VVASGGHIASGCDDGTILIREAESGKSRCCQSDGSSRCGVFAYFTFGHRLHQRGNRRFASGDSKTGKLLVARSNTGDLVDSVVWSLDGSNLYSASTSSQCFRSVSGTLLHSFRTGPCLYAVGISPKHNVLACVEVRRCCTAWGTESHKPLGQPFPRWMANAFAACHSSNGSDRSYGGADRKSTLWMVHTCSSYSMCSHGANISQAGPLQGKERCLIKPCN